MVCGSAIISGGMVAIAAWFVDFGIRTSGEPGRYYAYYAHVTAGALRSAQARPGASALTSSDAHAPKSTLQAGKPRALLNDGE